MSPRMGALAHQRILLGVTGSIAAYKSPLIVRELAKQGAEVHVILTTSARKFVGEATFSGLGVPVSDDIWQGPAEPHVRLARWASCLLIAPATAHFLANLATGTADNLLAATALCFSGPTLAAPAMHPNMWDHPATRDNVARLTARGVRFLGPTHGRVASGDEGMGRLLEPEALVAELDSTFPAHARSLAGRHLVVTAGPTREAIDPVRALTNLSSGKMGYALALEATRRGARVTLISGPVALAPPQDVQLVRVESALQMKAAIQDALGPSDRAADVLIMAAAVADYRPVAPQPEKIKRTASDLQLRLTPNPDILAELGQRRTGSRPVLVGFALETGQGEELVELGRAKLAKKRSDLIVANSVADSVGHDDNTVHLVSAAGSVPLGRMKKPLVAAHLLDWVEQRLSETDIEET